MFRLYIGDRPHVTRVLPLWVAAVFAFAGSAVLALAWVLLRLPDGVKIKRVVRTLGEPHHRFVPTTKTFATMLPVAIRPNNSIPQNDLSNRREDGKHNVVEWVHAAILGVITDFPTDASSVFRDTSDLWQHQLLRRYEVVERALALIHLSYAVRWRLDCQIDRIVGHSAD